MSKVALTWPGSAGEKPSTADSGDSGRVFTATVDVAVPFGGAGTVTSSDLSKEMLHNNLRAVVEAHVLVIFNGA
jgi:hypothetical protein